MNENIIQTDSAICHSSLFLMLIQCRLKPIV